MAQLPANAHKTMKIVTQLLPRTSMQPATLEIEFKDKKSLKYSWANETKPVIAGEKVTKAERASLAEIVEQVNQHARITGRAEELAG